MDISDLVTFAAVARCEGITRAAKELHTVQSNVTSRIKALEEEVGTPLFERHSRGVKLTSAGMRLLPYVSRAVMLLREASAAAREDGVARGNLKIGSMETTLAVRLPELLASYHCDHPDVELSVNTGPTAELVQRVLDNELDGAFVAGPVDSTSLDITPAFNERLVLVTSKKWSNLNDLLTIPSSVTALMFRAGCSYRQKLEQYLVSISHPNFKRLEFGTLEGILGCAAADVGITLLPSSVVENSAFREKVVIHDVDISIANTPTFFIKRKNVYESSAFRRFQECISMADQ